MKRSFVVSSLVLLAGAGCLPFPDEPSDVARCPADMPSEGGYCLGSRECTYGPEACQCGLPCHPAFGCDCIDGSWRCWHTDPMCPDVFQDVSPDVVQDAAPDAPVEVLYDASVGCPADPPFGLYAGCGAPRTCEYGTECCCGNCYASTVCTCNGDLWSCYATDACMIPACPDVFQDVRPDASQDVGPWDVPDVPPHDAMDVSIPDATDAWPADFVAPACCTKNADCGPGMACGAGDGGRGTCKPAVPFGQCWSLEDCPTGQTCQGEFVCPCTADCDAADHAGTCIAMPTGCCWVDGDCDAGKVCRAQGGIGGLPGSCVDDPAGPACVGDSACCWNDADCPKGTSCSGASACGCIELCPVCGACMPDRMGTCAAG